jgi:methionyl-tRNA synthetase
MKDAIGSRRRYRERIRERKIAGLCRRCGRHKAGSRCESCKTQNSTNARRWRSRNPYRHKSGPDLLDLVGKYDRLLRAALSELERRHLL